MPEINGQELVQAIRNIIVEITETEPEKITMEAKFVEDLGMDSMMALEILAAIEKKYKVQIPEDKLVRLTNLKETIALTKEYLDLT